jgi:hypothetical protein
MFHFWVSSLMQTLKTKGNERLFKEPPESEFANRTDYGAGGLIEPKKRSSA